MSQSADAALTQAVFTGMPVVRVSRGDAAGFVAHARMNFAVSGRNLTATKARVLLMAALLKLGALPLAADPTNPTDSEVQATRHALARYQQIFDEH